MFTNGVFFIVPKHMHVYLNETITKCDFRLLKKKKRKKNTTKNHRCHRGNIIFFPTGTQPCVHMIHMMLGTGSNAYANISLLCGEPLPAICIS